MKQIKNIITNEVIFEYGNLITSADLAGKDFTHADFSYTEFCNAILRNTDFSGANFRGANFRGANFNYANFNYANFRGANFNYANFDGSNFSGANFRHAYFSSAEFDWDQLKHIIPYIKSEIPKIPNIRQTIYEVCKSGRFDMGSWHSEMTSCGTTHCEAGFVTLAAGKAGLDLEKELGTALAAMVIYHENSSIKTEFTEFYQDNETALRRMKESAKGERDELK